MRGWRTLLLVGTAVFVVALVWNLPARQALLWWPLPPLEPAQVQGTVTHGSAEGLDAGGLRIQQLRWRLQPLSLLLARAEYLLELEDSPLGSGRVARGPGGSVRTRDVGLLMEARDLQPLFAEWGLQPGGRLVLDIDRGLYDADTLNLEGRVTWSEASAGGVELGVLTLDLRPDEDRTIGTLESGTDAPVSLQGELLIKADGTWNFSGELRPRSGLSPDLRNMLGLLGQPDSRGRYPLSWSGSL